MAYMRTNAGSGGAGAGRPAGAEGAAVCPAAENPFGCVSAGDGAVYYDRPAVFSYTPKANFVLPETPQVVMGGTTLVKDIDFTWSRAAGELCIPNVTGGVAVTVTAELDGVDYARREYLESSGSQYVDTGIIGGGNTSAELVFATLNSYPLDWWGRIGACQQDLVRSFLFAVYGAGAGDCESQNGTNKYGDFAYSFTPFTPYKVYINKTKTYVNDTLMLTLGAYSYTTPVTLYLFWQNCSVSTNMQKARMRLYRCDIREGDGFVRRFVPCLRLSDNKPGLYDEVSGAFFGNAGTGEFDCG